MRISPMRVAISIGSIPSCIRKSHSARATMKPMSEGRAVPVSSHQSWARPHS